MDELEELVNTDSYGKAVEGWADTTWNTITEIASTPALYQELLAVVGVCIFAYVTGRLLRHYFHNLREDPSIEYLSRLYPFCTLFKTLGGNPVPVKAHLLLRTRKSTARRKQNPRNTLLADV